MRVEPPNPWDKPSVPQQALEESSQDKVEGRKGSIVQRAQQKPGPSWDVIVWLLWVAAFFWSAGLVAVAFRYAVRAWTGGS